jgi:hypothetical protein
MRKGMIVRVSMRLLVVLALMLSGLPVWSGPAMASVSSPMTMMPGMTMDSTAMHHPMGAGKEAPPKPCCGEDGCCIAGSCALPMMLPAAELVERLEPAGDILFKDAGHGGITFPPSIRPPIAA